MPVLICRQRKFVRLALSRVILVHEADIDMAECSTTIVYDPDLPARAGQLTGRPRSHNQNSKGYYPD